MSSFQHSTGRFLKCPENGCVKPPYPSFSQWLYIIIVRSHRVARTCRRKPKSLQQLSGDEMNMCESTEQKRREWLKVFRIYDWNYKAVSWVPNSDNTKSSQTSLWRQIWNLKNYRWASAFYLIKYFYCTDMTNTPLAISRQVRKKTYFAIVRPVAYCTIHWPCFLANCWVAKQKVVRFATQANFLSKKDRQD